MTSEAPTEHDLLIELLEKKLRYMEMDVRILQEHMAELRIGQSQHDNKRLIELIGIACNKQEGENIILRRHIKHLYDLAE